MENTWHIVSIARDLCLINSRYRDSQEEELGLKPRLVSTSQFVHFCSHSLERHRGYISEVLMELL